MISILEKSDDVSVAQNEVHADVAVIVDDGTKNSVRKNVDSVSLSSSIGLLSDGDGSNEDGDEAESKGEVEGSLNSFAALEAALPLKRGLSNFYDGKSRTFMNLAEIKSVEEIEKEESPLNKRRRLMVAQNSLYKWGSSSSSSLSNFTPTSAEHTHSVGVEQVLKSSASNTSFTSLNSVNKQSIN